MFWDVLLLLVSLCYLINLYLSWNKNYWLLKGFPFVEREFLFGNVKDVVLMRKTIGQTYRSIYEKIGDKPLGGFFKLRQPILMIKSPDLVKEVLYTKFDNFQSNDIHLRRDASPLLKMNPMLVSGATWRSMKSIWSPLLGSKTPTAVIKSTAENMVSFVQSKCSSTVEGKELSRKFVRDFMSSWAIGIELDSFRNPNIEFQSMTDRIIKRNFKSNLALLFALYAPRLSNFFHFRIVSRRAVKYFSSIISKACQKRVKDQLPKDDFLQFLIDINRESEQIGEGTVFKYDQIVGHGVSLYFMGLAKMADPFCWCLYELSMNPEVQKKLRDELRTNNVTIDTVDPEKLSKLQYLDMVVLECCRLHPPIQSITRICTTETILEHDGLRYTVEVGIPVNVPVYALHVDPNYFPDPEKFLPDRFAQNSKISEIVYLPFGYGPRQCPGERLAKMALKIGIATLILDFEISSDDSLRTLDQDPMSSLVNAPKGDVPLRFKPIATS